MVSPEYGSVSTPDEMTHSSTSVKVGVVALETCGKPATNSARTRAIRISQRLMRLIVAPSTMGRQGLNYSPYQHE